MADFQEIQDMQPLLKTVYLPVRKNIFPKMNVALASAKRGSPQRVTYAGNDLFFVVKTGRRPGFVASADGFLPESARAAEKQGRLGVARTYFRVELDNFANKATTDPKGAYLSASKKLIEDVMEEWERQQNRILHGDSLAIRALVTAKQSDTVWDVASPYGIVGAGPGNLHLVVGDTVALLDSDASDAVLGKAKITDITLVTSTSARITVSADLDGGATGAAGDKIVTAVPTAVSATDTSFAAEPHGFKSIVDVENAFETFEGIKDSRWEAQSLVSAVVDEIVLMKLLNQIRARAGVDWRNGNGSMLLLTTTGIWQRYGDALLGFRRFSAPTMELNGGFKGVQVAGTALVDDPWGPRGRLYAIHTPDTIFIDLMDFGMTSHQDAPKWQRSQNRDAYDAVFAAYWNYGVTNRASHGVISGITDDENFSPIFA